MANGYRVVSAADAAAIENAGNVRVTGPDVERAKQLAAADAAAVEASKATFDANVSNPNKRFDRATSSFVDVDPAPVKQPVDNNPVDLNQTLAVTAEQYDAADTAVFMNEPQAPDTSIDNIQDGNFDQPVAVKQPNVLDDLLAAGHGKETYNTSPDTFGVVKQPNVLDDLLAAGYGKETYDTSPDTYGVDLEPVDCDVAMTCNEPVPPVPSGQLEDPTRSGWSTVDPNIPSVPMGSAKSKNEDWRVRLSIPDGLDRFYNGGNAGILAPLKKTNGIIFPYTPEINIQYAATYNNYDLTHSNYRGYFYKGSAVQNLLITATFTAQDTDEADYLLASLHFLRSCTKMFYGQDDIRGTPPPVLFLNGLGDYHFNNHPCVMTMFSYDLPNDVDYIAAGTPDGADPTQNFMKTLSTSTSSTGASRLAGSNVPPGADASQRQAKPTFENPSKQMSGKTYVPTKIDLNFTMLPIQTRKQVSKDFSLRDYASGDLLTKGFW